MERIRKLINGWPWSQVNIAGHAFSTTSVAGVLREW